MDHEERILSAVEEKFASRPRLTGVVSATADKLVLKPLYGYTPGMRKGALACNLAMILLAAVLVMLYTPVVALWLIVPVLALWATFASLHWLTQMTIIAVAGEKEIRIETRFVGKQLRWKRVIARISDIDEVIIDRIPASGPPTPGNALFNVHYATEYSRIRVRIGTKKKLIWYTKFHETAAQIARSLSSITERPISTCDQEESTSN